MQEGEARPHDHGLPTALYVISGASFAAALSARALDPVLPHVAEDFGVSIATAAGFAAVFAFTFSIIQPIIGAAADLFGKTSHRRARSSSSRVTGTRPGRIPICSAR